MAWIHWLTVHIRSSFVVRSLDVFGKFLLSLWAQSQKLTYLQHKRLWFDTFYMYSQVCIVQKHLVRPPRKPWRTWRKIFSGRHHGDVRGTQMSLMTLAIEDMGKWLERYTPSLKLTNMHLKNSPKPGNKRKGSSSKSSIFRDSVSFREGILPKTNSSPLKNDGWKMNISL